MILQGGANERLNNSASVNLSGGKLSLNAGAGASITETVGQLTLSGSSSVIDFGASNSAYLTFASGTWSTGGLKVYNWSGIARTGGGTDRLFFTSALTTTQASSIEFYSGEGTGFLGTGAMISGGELVPVPEVGSSLAILGFASCAWQRNSRRNRRRAAQCQLE